MIRGSNLPSPLQVRDLDCKLGSGLGLAQNIARQNSFAHTRTNFFHFLTDLALS